MVNASPKIALIAGASGLVGSHLLSLLLDSEDFSKVYAIVRKPLGVGHPKLEERIIDFDQIEQMTFPTPIDIVFCTLGTTRGKAKSAENFKKVDLHYIVALGKWSAEHHAKKFLVISAMGANSNSKSLYMQTKGEMETQVQSFNISHIAIFRPSLLVGPRKERRIGEWIAGHVTLPIFGLFLPKKYRRVQTWKVAKAMFKIAQSEHSGIEIIQSDKIHELVQS